jgi:septal ring factor EnvC (AmiA/AmiB activator)
VIDWKMRSKRMALWKRELVDSLNRDLTRARHKRDAFTSSVTTLTAQISELEARLSAETERRQRDRVAGEIVVIKKRVRDRSSVFDCYRWDPQRH